MKTGWICNGEGSGRCGSADFLKKLLSDDGPAILPIRRNDDKTYGGDKMKRMMMLVLLLTALCICSSCGKKDAVKGLQMQGSYYDNIGQFKAAGVIEREGSSEAPVSGPVAAYIQKVTYEIKDLDEKNMTATVEVRVPDIGKLLPQVIWRITDEYAGSSFDELLALVQEELERELREGTVEGTISELTMEIEEVDGEYMLVYNEQWTELVFGSMEQWYIESVQRMIGGDGYEAMD